MQYYSNNIKNNGTPFPNKTYDNDNYDDDDDVGEGPFS